ncbi:hypothetical protein [Amycolatopsis sp. 3B14]|uniref:hypothetical protein n=1 Tax=Amycolatopsis sp. 3B14 TaxID=3243600 RepID=UPI003D97502B
MAQLVRPMLDGGQVPPTLPTFEQQARVQALLAGHATPEVKALFQTYSDAVLEIIKVDQLPGDLIQHGDREIGVSRGELWQRLDTKITSCGGSSTEALADRVSAELRG